MSPVRMLFVPVLLLAACSDAIAPEPPLGEAGVRAAGTVAGADRVSVMTQNLYIGADVDQVLLALLSPDPADDFPALLETIETFERTDFPSRAEALADEIARLRPHAVGLQEVSEVQIVLPPFGLDLQLEFLPVLEAALASRGLNYVVGAQVLNIDATPAPGIRQVDYDVLLVDADRVDVVSTAAANYSLNLGFIAPGVELKRGWVLARTIIGGDPYTFVSTHPEPDLGGQSFADLRAAQIAELVAIVGADERVILMGDLNDEEGSPMYQVLLGAGFSDVWREMHPGAAGLTCCHESDLSDHTPAFDQRIDYIMVRGFEHRNREVLGQIRRVGVNPSDRVDGALGAIWVSDHAGLFASLLRPARGRGG